MALGFLMVGGRSRRIRRTKADLAWYPGGSSGEEPPTSLARHLCGVLASVCTSTYLLGDRAVDGVEVPRLSDATPHSGPLGGLLSALEMPGPTLRIILSCDTPFVDAVLLRQLLQAAETAAVLPDVVVARDAEGCLHPLCAVYHQRLGRPLRSFLHAHARERLLQDAPDAVPGKAPSLQQFLDTASVETLEVTESRLLRNLNTMQEYLAALRGR